MSNSPTPLYHSVLIELGIHSRVYVNQGQESLTWGAIQQVVAWPTMDGAYNFTVDGTNYRVYYPEFSVVVNDDE